MMSGGAIAPHMSTLSTHDKTRTDDTRIGAVRPLITPALLERLGGLGRGSGR